MNSYTSIRTRITLLSILAFSCDYGLAANHSADVSEDVANGYEASLASQHIDFGDQGDVILQVFLRDILLTDGLFAIMRKGELFLPLAEFSAMLDFPILVDPVAGTASGWFLKPDNTFSLDVRAGIATVQDIRFEFSNDNVFSDEYDVFVSISLLQEWLPLFLDVSLASQVMQVRSSEKLPKELARERAVKKAEKDLVFAATNEYDIPAYRLLDWPEISLGLGGFYSPENDLASESTNYDYSVRATGDFAFMNGIVSFSGRQNTISNATMTLGRSNPQGMLGPLRAADFELGDTSQFLPGMIGSSLSGRGIRFGNRRLADARDLDTIDVQGAQQEDYEVELYVNNRLRGVDRDSSDNIYDFQDVALQLGQNEIRLEFYGPQGQQFTETNRTFVGSGQGREGVFKYEFALVQPNERVFDVFDETEEDENDDEMSIFQYSSALDLAYSLSSRTRLGLTIANFLANDKEGDTTSQDNFLYTNAQAVTDMSGVLMSSDITLDPNGHVAGALSARTALGDYELGVTQRLFQRDFQNANTINNDDEAQVPIRTATAVNLSRWFFQIPSGRLSYSASAGYELDYEDTASTILGTNLDYQNNLVDLSWSQQYRFSPTTNDDSMDGRVGARFRISDYTMWSLSSNISYNDNEDQPLTSGSLRATRPLFAQGNLSLGATRDLQVATNSYSVSWGKRFKSFQLNTSVAGSSMDDLSFRVGMEFTVRRYPNRWLPAFSSTGGRGAVAVVVFGDENQNGTQDALEPVLEGVRLTRNRLMAGVATDHNGVAILSGLSVNTPVDIGILESDIKQPGLKFDGIDKGVLVRPGRIPLVKVALQPATDIEGTVMITGKDGDIPAPNVRIILTPLDGGDPLEIYTEFDGYYYLANLPLGVYDIGPDEEQLKAAGLVAYPATRRLELTNLDDFPPPEDFVLYRQSDIQMDSDGDSVPEVAAAFPLDPAETVDSDNDGVGDNSDAEVDGVKDEWYSMPP